MTLRIYCAILCLVLTGTAQAHHGIWAFDHDSEMEITGVVSGVEFVNPHAWLHLDVAGDNGDVKAWKCEMRSATVLRRSGWSRDMFRTGEAVTIKGSPAKLAETDCYLANITFEDGRSFDRYAQIDAESRIPSTGRPPRLASGEPNISGDWAPEQFVLTDSTGVSGAFVPLSVAQRIQAGGEIPQEMLRPFPGGRGHTDMNREVFHQARGLTDAGMKIYDDHDPTLDNPRFRCEPTSIIFDWTFDTHVNRIVQKPGRITMRYGFMDMVRTIHMDLVEHPADVEPSRAGHSIGRWEDDVLIVDTVLFAPGVISTMGSAGFVPNSDQVRIEERYSLNEPGDVLERRYVIEDPLYLVEAVSGSDRVNISDLPFEAYNCDDKSFASPEGFETQTRVAE